MNIKLKTGDLFSFTTSEKNKYGLIQAVSKGKIGVNVRVFCNVFTDLSYNNIKRILEFEEFYYLKDFYEYELLNKSQAKLGNYKIPTNIEIPQYMRISERKLNGDLIWYIVDTNTSRITKTFNVFNEELRSLSPAKTWGIDYIKKRWEDKFTLQTWDNNLEDKWYTDYLNKYEPNKLLEKEKIALSKIRKLKPTIVWKKNAKQILNNYNLSEGIINEIDRLLDNFLEDIEKSNLDSINEITKKLINELNSINDIHNCIETEESEQLLDFITTALQTIENKKDIEDYSSIRTW